MSINVIEKDVRLKSDPVQQEQKSVSNGDAMQQMLAATLKAMHSLLKLQSKEMQGQSDISEMSSKATDTILKDYKVKMDEYMDTRDKERSTNDALKYLGWACAIASVALGFIVGGPAGMVVALGLAILLTPGLTSPSANGDTSILGSALDNALEDMDASPATKGAIKLSVIAGLCLFAGGVGGAAGAATRTAGSAFTTGRFLAIEAGVQGLSGLNPVQDLAMIGADENDQERKEIAQWVSFGVNLAASLAMAGFAFKTGAAAQQSFEIFGSSSAGRNVNSAVTGSTALLETGKSGTGIYAGTVSLDIAAIQEGLAYIESTLTKQNGTTELGQQNMARRSKEYKGMVEEITSQANDYTNWNDGLYASARALANGI